jgi:gamma-glutamyl hydrolase
MIFDLVIQANDNGVYLPLWGTCLGHELIQTCARRANDTLGDFDGDPYYTRKLMFTSSARESRMFADEDGGFAKEIIKSMHRNQLVVFSHSFGVSPAMYAKSAQLSSFFKPLAISRDRKNKEYVAIAEAWEYPIYGCQFHPEKNVFEWLITLPIPH